MKTFIKNNFLPLTLCLLIIIAFILLQPTSVSSLNINNKEARWNNFVKKVEGHRMDTKAFWETREFYSPGHFAFKKEGFAVDKQAELIRVLGAPDLGLSNQLVFLEYNASAFISYESLIKDENAPNVLKSITLLSGRNDVLAKGENFVIIKINQDKAIIIFLTTLDEMKKANGFFKYDEDDKDLVKGKNWFDISEVRIN
jgi:hypothetical protein